MLPWVGVSTLLAGLVALFALRARRAQMPAGFVFLAAIPSAYALEALLQKLDQAGIEYVLGNNNPGFGQTSARVVRIQPSLGLVRVYVPFEKLESAQKLLGQERASRNA